MLRELQETNAALQDVRDLLRQQVPAGGGGLGVQGRRQRLGRGEVGLGGRGGWGSGKGPEKLVLMEVKRGRVYGKEEGEEAGRGGPKDEAFYGRGYGSLRGEGNPREGGEGAGRVRIWG